MKKFFLTLLLLISLTFSQVVYAEVLSGSGFIPGQIWYSKDSLTEGDVVDIYTALWNDKSSPIVVKVGFYDNKTLLGTRDITLKSKELKNASISWKVTSGDHTILAKIISSETENTKGEKDSVSLSNVTTSTSKNSVSAVAKDAKGNSVDITDDIKNKIENTIPEDVTTSVSNNFKNIEDVRKSNSSKLENLTSTAKDELETIKKNQAKEIKKGSSSKGSTEDSITKPLAYLKYFILSIISFVFKNQIIFYGLIVLLAFYVLRFIYRKIRHR